MHMRLLRALYAGLLTLSLIMLVSGVALAAKPSAIARTNSPLGNDISWPQCGKRLPAGQAFGIVGVNNGVANTTNPCLATELSWAASSVGGTGQPLTAVYVNTANPSLQGSWWPTSNTYAGATIKNPYGTCTGLADPACAYMYGYAKADDDATIRGVPNPSALLWWLDVETTNTWQPDTAANTADLEGMATYFKSIGASVGIYSTSSQWQQIVGTLSPFSPLFSLHSWLAGASSQASAKSLCAAPPLTEGGMVFITQYVSRGLDYDFSCM